MLCSLAVLDVLDDPRIRMRLKFFRYYLSTPEVDLNSTPPSLRIKLTPFWWKLRLGAAVFAVVVVASCTFDILRNGWADIEDQAPALFVALVGAVAFCGGVTFGAKQLLAAIGPTDVHVQEAGIGTWKQPLSAYRGVAWLYYKQESYTRIFQLGRKTESIELTNPEVTLYHWIELLHPDRAKSLVLAVGPEEAGMRERLQELSRGLNRPIVAVRLEDDGIGSIAALANSAG
jgi:hypothetical protein